MITIVIIITIIEIIVKVIVIAITKIKVIKEKSVIRTEEWNNKTSLFVIPAFYSNVIIPTNQLKFYVKKCVWK